MEELHRERIHLNLDTRKKALEIGTQRLEYTKYLMNHFELVFGCDPYRHFPDDVYLDLSNVEQSEMNFLYEQAKEYAKNSENLILIRKESLFIANWFPDSFFDYIHLDGNHMYHYVIRELEAFWPKVKPGGIFSGHDYGNWYDDKNSLEVKKAVDEWISRKNLKLELAKERDCGSWFIRKH